MIIAELSIYQNSAPLINHSPFVVKQLPGTRSTASYWTTTFGATGEVETGTVFINSVIELPSTQYTRTTSIVSCQGLERSFYWDNGAQVLYIHHDHAIFPTASAFSIGQAYGATNLDLRYIDNVCYDPVLLDVPGISQKADLIAYDKLAFMSGSVVFSNVGGYFDEIIRSPIYGNALSIYYLDNTVTNPTRDDLTPLATLYVEDYEFTLDKFTVRVQDQRKAQNAKILSLKTALGVDVPLVYGSPRACTALVDQLPAVTGSVVYRAAVELTDIGTVQVWNETTKTWDTKTPTSTDLANGRFTLSQADGRQGGTASGTPVKARLSRPTGIPAPTPCAVIADLNDRVIGIPYTDGFYNIEEIAESCASLSEVAVVYNKNIELYDAIKLLQNGSKIGFRYEVQPDGLRTIRTDDWTRTSKGYLQIDTGNETYLATETGALIYAVTPYPALSRGDIKDNLTLKVTTDSSIFAASVKVKYDKDFDSGDFISTTNTDFLDQAYNKYRQKPEMEFETVLRNQADAEYRALWQAGRLSEIRGQLSCELHGQDFYTLRIYDMIDVDLGTASRQYFGRWKAQVIGINPQFGELSNRITAVLTEEII